MSESYQIKLKKMAVKVDSHRQVEYFLPHNDKRISIDSFLGWQVEIKFDQKIFCVACDRVIKKAFQGFCYPCFTTLAKADMCQVRPETCHFHLGTCRQEDWAKEQCFIPHTLYLSYTSGFKVGITRSYQQTNRWVDQGAILSTVVGQASSRLAVGKLEHKLKNILDDKTHWSKMLKLGKLSEEEMNELKSQLSKKREEVIKYLETVLERDEELAGSFKLAHPNIDEFNFPNSGIENLNEKKVSSISLDKVSQFSGELLGIKGQYWYLSNPKPENISVINIRKFEGYQIELTIA